MPQQRPPVDYDAIAAAVSSQDVDYDAIAKDVMTPTAGPREPSAAPAPSTLRRIASGAGQALEAGARGLVTLSGVPGIIREGPVGALKDQFGVVRDVFRAHGDTYQKAKTAEREGRTSEMVGYAAASAIPVLGPMAARWGEMSGSGQAPEALGEALTGGLVRVAPRAANTAAVNAAHTAASTGTRGAAAIRSGVQTMREHPAAAAFGAYEGYQAAGVPGMVAGAVGLPVGMRGAARVMGLTKRDVSPDAKWEQEARNLNARDAYLAKQAQDLAVHQRMAERIQQAQTRADITAAKTEWQEILQHAKNLNAREKKLGELAAEQAAKDRAAALFPDGAQAGRPSQRVTSTVVTDGVKTTTSQTLRPRRDGMAVADDAADEFFESIAPRMETNGIAESAARARELSRKLVLTPQEQTELAQLNARMKLSASEAGMTYPAAQSPSRYRDNPEGGVLIDQRPVIGLRKRR